MAEIYGIDVSRYQGQINWQKVKASGKQFVFIRLGWCGFDGKIKANSGLDIMFESNIKGALAAGLNVGVYLYSYAKTPTAARVAALETLDLVKSYQLTYPIAFDIESISQSESSGACYDKMSKTDNTAICAAFLDEIEKAKYYGILYTYKSFAENYLDMTALKQYDMWIAQYALKCTYSGNYGIWQYSGDKGRCDGVPTACDLNVSYMDYATIIKQAGLNGFAKPTEPTPAPEPTELDRLREEKAKLQQDVIDLNARITELEGKLKKINDLSA